MFFFFRFFPPFLYRAVPPQAELYFASFLAFFHRAADLLDDRVEELPRARSPRIQGPKRFDVDR